MVIEDKHIEVFTYGYKGINETAFSLPFWRKEG